MKLSGLSLVALILIAMAVSPIHAAHGKERKRCVMCQPFEVCNDMCVTECQAYFAGVGKCVSKTQCECRVGEAFCASDLRPCNVTRT